MRHFLYDRVGHLKQFLTFCFSWLSTSKSRWLWASMWAPATNSEREPEWHNIYDKYHVLTAAHWTHSYITGAQKQRFTRWRLPYGVRRSHTHIDAHSHTHTQQACPLIYLSEPSERKGLVPQSLLDCSHFNYKPFPSFTPFCACHKTVCSIALSLQRKSVILSLRAVTGAAVSGLHAARGESGGT